jgi:hypothetical protein
MTRDHNKAVTGKEAFALLIPASPKEAVGEATFQMELAAPQPMRLFTLADARQAAKKLTGAAGDRFFALLALRGALESRDVLALDDAKKRLERTYLSQEPRHPFQPSANDPERQRFAELMANYIGLSPEESLKHLEGRRAGPKAQADPHRLLSYEITREVSLKAQIALWWKEGHFRPAIYCMDLETAYYVHTFFIAPTGELGYRVCPKCSEIFFQDRPNDVYCSPGHRESHRVKRWRHNKKRKAVQTVNKEAKDGTQKAR